MFRRGHLEERSEGTGEARKAFHNPRRCQRAGTVRKLLASDREPDEKLASGYRHGRLEPNRRRAHHARSPSGSLIGHHASRPSPNDQLALAHHRATNGGQVRYEEGSGPPRLQPLMETRTYIPRCDQAFSHGTERLFGRSACDPPGCCWAGSRCSGRIPHAREQCGNVTVFIVRALLPSPARDQAVSRQDEDGRVKNNRTLRWSPALFETVAAP